MKVKVKVTQSWLTLCHPMNYRVHGILQARILEWVALPFSRRSSQPSDWPSFPALQSDSLAAEPQGKPRNIGVGIPVWYKRKNYGNVVIKNRDMEAVEKNLHPMCHFSESFERCIPSNFVTQSLSCVWLFATPQTAARQASLSIINSRSLPKPMSIVSVMPSNHLILCRPLLLPPSFFPSIRVFSSESVLCIRWLQLQHQSLQWTPRTNLL